MDKANFEHMLKLRKTTRYQLSKATGISDSLLSDYVNYGMKPGEDKLILIADYLDCSIDYLVGRTDCLEINRGDRDKDVGDEGRSDKE